MIGGKRDGGKTRFGKNLGVCTSTKRSWDDRGEIEKEPPAPGWRVYSLGHQRGEGKRKGGPPSDDSAEIAEEKWEGGEKSRGQQMG